MLTAAAFALAATTDTVRVMTYNIWVGGTQSQPLSQTVKVIEASRSDVVGIQEPGPNLPAIAQGLGWNRSDKSAIITRHSILEDWAIEATRWGGARIKLPSGQILTVYNTHLTAYPYGPYEVRDGNAKTPAEAVAVEAASGRLAEVNAILRDMAKRLKREDNVAFTGDFNTPSHHDWVKSTRARTFGMAVQWPVTWAVEAMGFRDAYRVIHKNPTKKPGYTWSPGYPVPNIAKDDVMDRIDLVFFRGPGIKPVKAEVVGETGPVTDIAVDPWPSDHRAVVCPLST
jgi:endonuclease/exonuclease/phosphatase family metal-dependent hydrolase